MIDRRFIAVTRNLMDAHNTPAVLRNRVEMLLQDAESRLEDEPVPVEGTPEEETKEEEAPGKTAVLSKGQLVSTIFEGNPVTGTFLRYRGGSEVGLCCVAIDGDEKQYREVNVSDTVPVQEQE